MIRGVYDMYLLKENVLCGTRGREAARREDMLFFNLSRVLSERKNKRIIQNTNK